jgi:hypothetical protein
MYISNYVFIALKEIIIVRFIVTIAFVIYYLKKIKYNIIATLINQLMRG